MRDSLRLQRADRGQGGEHGVAVVGAATTVELPVFEQRVPRSVAWTPTYHLRLFVEVSVQQHGAITLVGARHVEIEQGSASRQADDFQREPAHALLSDPRFGEPDDAFDMTISLPCSSEVRRLRRDADVIGE